MLDALILPKTKQGLPVLEGGLPLVGHMFRCTEDLPLLFEATVRELGPQFWMKLSEWTLMCAGQEGFDLFKNRTTTSAHYKDLVPTFVGESLLGADGSPHRRMRSAMNGPFTPKGIATSGAAAVSAEVVEAHVARFDAPSVRIHEETQTIALHIVFRVMDIPQSDLGAWASKFQEFLLTAFPLALDAPLMPRRKGRLAGDWIDERFRRILAEVSRQADRSGLLRALLEAETPDGAGLSEREMLDNLRLLALAGHETTASTMAWLALELAKRPELFEQLVDESIAAPGLPTSAKDLERHPLAEGIFREALRLYPPLGMTSRRVTTAMRVGSFDAQPGDVLGIPIALYGRDADRYPNPSAFDPRRWIDRPGTITPIETFAFGGGPHFCLGYHFAWLETVQFAVAFARRLHALGLRPRLAPGTELIRRYRPFAQPPAGSSIVFERR